MSYFPADEVWLGGGTEREREVRPGSSRKNGPAICCSFQLLVWHGHPQAELRPALRSRCRAIQPAPRPPVPATRFLQWPRQHCYNAGTVRSRRSHWHWHFWHHQKGASLSPVFPHLPTQLRCIRLSIQVVRKADGLVRHCRHDAFTPALTLFLSWLPRSSQGR